MQDDLGEGFHIVEAGLNGRTTVFDDPVMGGMSGLNDLLNVLTSNMPVDLLVIMLGTNDVKTRFNVNADEIARSLGRLLRLASTSTCGPAGQAPEILVLIPPVVGPLAGTSLEGLFGNEKSQIESQRLRETYPPIASDYGAHCFDTAQVISPGKIDAIHMDPDQLRPFATAVAQVIRNLFGSEK